MKTARAEIRMTRERIGSGTYYAKGETYHLPAAVAQQLADEGFGELVKPPAKRPPRKKATA